MSWRGCLTAHRHALTRDAAPTRYLKQGDGSPISEATTGVAGRSLSVPPTTPWSSQDRDDLSRLGRMFAGFLHVQPFGSSSTSFQKLVTNPLCQVSGPAYGAVWRIKEIMSKLLVKHRFVVPSQARRLIRFRQVGGHRQAGILPAIQQDYTDDPARSMAGDDLQHTGCIDRQGHFFFCWYVIAYDIGAC